MYLYYKYMINIRSLLKKKPGSNNFNYFYFILSMFLYSFPIN